MSHTERRKLIGDIERLRSSKVLVYVTGDRQPVPANIGDDAVRPIAHHLRRMGHVEKLDVFIYSRGGAIDVPWRLNSAFRRMAQTWDALVPFRANSAATLLCLGADRIVLGNQAELGPIDPTLQLAVPGPTGPEQMGVSVEDVMAFPKFATERFGLVDETSKATALTLLAGRIDAVTLGNLYRTHSHIRYLAEQMLNSRGETMDHSTVENIVSTLAERVYAHGHAVGLEEAQNIGLHVETAEPEVEEAMWALLEQYEEDMGLLNPIDPFTATQANDVVTEPVTMAVIESADITHEYRGELRLEAKRQMPQSLQVQLNLPVQLPPGIDPTQLPAALQQMMQAMPGAMLPHAQAAVGEALRTQAPVTNVDGRILDGRWRLI